MQLTLLDGEHDHAFVQLDDLVGVGDIVLAMGNPLGLASSATNGIISATGRTVTEPASADSPGATLTDCLRPAQIRLTSR